MSGANKHGTFCILFVCTGNICRSPTAEILTRHHLGEALNRRGIGRFTVLSAGTQALVGAPIHPMARDELRRWKLAGEPSRHFRAKQLRKTLVHQADLILGASPHHRSDVLAEFPEVLPITFSLREFARLLAASEAGEQATDSVDRAHRLVDQARRLRGKVPSDDDRIADPMGGTAESFANATKLIDQAVTTITRRLA